MRSVYGIAAVWFISAGALATSTQSWEDRLALGLKAHEAATTLYEWQNSSYHPLAIAKNFSQASQNKSRKGDLCQALEKLPLKDLMVYAELLYQRHLSLPCRAQLLKRLKNSVTISNRRWGDENLNSSQEPQMTYHHVPQASSSLPSEEVILDTKGGPFLVNGDTEPGEFVLTFDDGPNPNHTPAILDILDDFQVKAIFFATGKQTQRRPELVREIVRRGHTLGGHTYSHPHLPSHDHSTAWWEITHGFEVLLNTKVSVAPFFRFPYGARTHGLITSLKERDIAEFFWAVDTLDWKIKDPEELLDYATQKTKEAGQGIILFHDIHFQTRSVLRSFLSWMSQQKYETIIYRPERALKRKDLLYGSDQTLDRY